MDESAYQARIKQLEDLLSECYGAWLALGLVTPPAQMPREEATFLYTMAKKVEEAGIRPWKVRIGDVTP